MTVKNFEWKTIGVDKPEVGKWYIVVNSSGKYSIRYYDLLYREIGFNSKVFSATGSMAQHVKETYDIDPKPFEGFTGGQWYATLYKNPVYFIELPDLPEANEISQRKAEMYNCRKRAEQLQRELDTYYENVKAGQ